MLYIFRVSTLVCRYQHWSVLVCIVAVVCVKALSANPEGGRENGVLFLHFTRCEYLYYREQAVFVKEIPTFLLAHARAKNQSSSRETIL